MVPMLIADLFYENRYSHTRMTNPDFIKLSESMGAKALRCTNLAELPAMMKEFLEYDGTRPILMECLVSSEHVYPMVAAGKALHEQIVSSAT
jgi:acetolactate synthase-1/2/3 large subunit